MAKPRSSSSSFHITEFDCFTVDILALVGFLFFGSVAFESVGARVVYSLQINVDVSFSSELWLRSDRFNDYTSMAPIHITNYQLVQSTGWASLSIMLVGRLSPL